MKIKPYRDADELAERFSFGVAALHKISRWRDADNAEFGDFRTFAECALDLMCVEIDKGED